MTERQIVVSFMVSVVAGLKTAEIFPFLVKVLNSYA